jgi:hypothetical protein
MRRRRTWRFTFLRATLKACGTPADKPARELISRQTRCEAGAQSQRSRQERDSSVASSLVTS